MVRTLSALLFALLIAACSGGGAASTAPSVAPASETPPASEAPVSAPASQGASECVKVTHALGDSCIPADPQRVVTLGCQTSLEYALALGLPVVGYDVVPWEPIVPPYIDKGLLAGASEVGGCFAPDLELVKAAKPDLVVYTFDNGNYPQVSEIAPTVVLQVGYVDWRADFTAAAALLGRTAQAESYLVELDARIAALKAELEPAFAGKSISAFQTGTDGKATIYGTESYHGALLADLGLSLPADQTGGWIEVSLEQIALLDGAVGLAVFGYTDPSLAEAGSKTQKEYTDNPLWATLAFVGSGDLHEMDPEVWNVHGIYWVDGMLEDLRAKLLP